MQNKKSINARIRQYLLTGILVWLPIVVSIWVINFIISSSDDIFNLLPPKWQPQNLIGVKIPGLGFIFAAVILFFTGLLAANVLGKRFIRMWENIFNHIPVIKSVYSSVKKVSESLLSDSRQSFKTPVLVQFPHKDVWTIGFVSGSIPDGILSNEYLSVYVPTTPNPTGGYYIMVKKADTQALDLTVDEALKYVISLGMVMPTNAAELKSATKLISEKKVK